MHAQRLVLHGRTLQVAATQSPSDKLRFTDIPSNWGVEEIGRSLSAHGCDGIYDIEVRCWLEMWVSGGGGGDNVHADVLLSLFPTQRTAAPARRGGGGGRGQECRLLHRGVRQPPRGAAGAPHR